MTTNITTPGALFIKSLMPNQKTKDNYDLSMRLDKPGMSKLINMLVDHGGDQAYETINKLPQIFFNKATQIGASTPISDYENDSDERQAIFSEFDHKVKEIVQSKLDKKLKLKKLDDLAFSTRKYLNSQNLK